MKKAIFISVILICLVILNFILDYMDKESPLKTKISMESSFFREIEFIQKREGNLKLKLYSQEAKMLEDGKILELGYITMFFPEREFTVKAKKGTYYIETGDIVLKEEIEGFSKDYTILGTEATWIGKDKTLYSDKPLKIKNERFVIEGNAGIARADLIELKKGVTAVVYSKN